MHLLNKKLEISFRLKSVQMNAQTDRVSLALPLASCATLGKMFNSLNYFFIYKLGITLIL